MVGEGFVRERRGVWGLIAGSSMLAAITCWPQLFTLPAAIFVTPRQQGRKRKAWMDGGK